MQVTLATDEDIIGIVYVQATTWIATYQSDKYDILESDLREIDWQGKIPAWQHMVKSSDYNVYVVKSSDGSVHGFASLVCGDESRLQDMYVLPELQSQGIGSELMQRILADTDGSISLHVAEYNERAIGFYSSFGFVGTGGVSQYKLPNNKAIPTVEMRYRPSSTDPAESGQEKQLVGRAKLAQMLNERESTVKWYVELGLLPFEQAGEGLRRYFDVEVARDRYEQIKHLQSMGYSLEDIADYWQSGE